MRYALAALVLSFSIPAAEAGYTRACGAAFTELKRNSKKARIKQTTVTAQAQVGRLAALEQKSLASYRRKFNIRRAFIEGEEGEFFELHTQTFPQKRTNRLNGYKISVSMGGDEDTVAFYFDPQGRLLFWHWYNQSPESGWVCERY